MKKKLAILAGVLVLSSVSFSATAPAKKSSLEDSLNNLEKQLQRLDQMEQQKFNEQAALAQAAQQRLDKYLAMQATIDQRMADIEANADKSIFGKEFKQKMSEFKSLRAALDKEIKKEQKVLEDFELLKSLR